MKLMMKWLKNLVLVQMVLFSAAVFAEELTCDICGMMIPPASKNHIVASVTKPAAKKLHICSLGCLKNAFKNISNIESVEFADFHNPSKFVPADKATFLLGSKKIKSDLGDMVMPPYFGAFSDPAQAEAVQKKYGDGRVAKGLAEALR